MKSHLNKGARHEVRSVGTAIIRMACAAAFASVAISVIVPTWANAADPSAVAATQAGLPAGAYATVNGVALPQAQLDATAQALASRTGQPVTPQLLDVARQQLIVREVLRQAADKAGYGTRPEVQQAARETAADVAIQLYIRDHAHAAPVTDAQVKARYDAAVATLGTQEYKWSMISVPDVATAQRVQAALKSGQDFAAVARQYSIAPSRAAGGEMPWISFPSPATEGRTQGLPLPLAQALTSLPIGGVTSQPVQAGNMWIVAKLDSKRVMRVPPFDEAKGSIRNQLQAQLQAHAVTQLTGSLLRAAAVQQ